MGGSLTTGASALTLGIKMTQYRIELEKQTRSYELHMFQPLPKHPKPQDPTPIIHFLKRIDWFSWGEATVVVGIIIIVLNIVWGE